MSVLYLRVIARVTDDADVGEQAHVSVSIAAFERHAGLRKTLHLFIMVFQEIRQQRFILFTGAEVVVLFLVIQNLQ